MRVCVRGMRMCLCVWARVCVCLRWCVCVLLHRIRCNELGKDCKPVRDGNLELAKAFNLH